MIQLFNYRKLLSVDIMHRYYRTMQSADLIFTPSEECSRILRGYGLAFRRKDSGFTLLAEVREDGNLKKPVDKNLRLTFFGTLVNPSFENFTELPLERAQNQKFILNNLQLNSRNLFGSGAACLLLNQGNNITDQDLTKTARNVYRFEKAMAGDEKEFILVLRPEGKRVNRQNITSLNGIFSWQLDLGDLPAGNYSLEADGTVVDNCYFNPEPASLSAFVILEIFTDVPLGNQFIINTNEISEKTYRIAFLNRSTFWRYKVSNRNNHSLTHPAIAIGSNTGLFIHDGQLVFTSGGPMEIKEEPVKGIRFLKNSSITSSEILNDLPNPGIGQILPVLTGGSYKIYSDIFIYI